MSALHPGHAFGRDSLHGIQCAHDGGCFASGGRQLTLYLKVAITGLPTEFRWMVRVVGVVPHLGGPL